LEEATLEEVRALETVPRLGFTDDHIRRINMIKSRSKLPGSWWNPEHAKWAPGGIEADHVLELKDYRFTFVWINKTVSKVNYDLVRYLLCINKTGGYPHPFLVYTLAPMFGFTGATLDKDISLVVKPAETWVVGKHELRRATFVAENISVAEANRASHEYP
jgi:hypothetical protein